MRSGTKFLWLLLALCFLLMPVWNSVSPVSAQNGSDDALDLLEEEAERQNKTLGSYLWDLLNGGFQSLGDLAAGTLEAFLEEGGTLQVENMTITLSGSDAGNSETGHEAYYDIVLKNGDSEEAALLILHMDAVRLYVNEKIYPQMVEGSGDGRQIRSTVKDDIALLLERLNIVPKDGSSVGNRVWEQLSNHLGDYPAFESLMKIPTEDNDGDNKSDDLITILVENTSGETSDLEKYLDKVGEGGEGQSGGGSSDGAIHLTNGNQVIKYAKGLGAEQVSSSTADILGDLEEEILELADPGSGNDGPGNGNSGNGGASASDGTWYLTGTVLPATGFSSRFVTELREQPLSLTYGTTGMLLQIPELEVSEMILTIPNEAGVYAIDWLDRNVGMLVESSLPGSGVTVLTGHNHLNTMEAGPFLFIGELQKDDRVFITNRENELYAYKVYGNYKIAADDFAAIAGDVHEHTLILITCEDEAAEGGYLNRRVIFADPS